MNSLIILQNKQKSNIKRGYDQSLGRSNNINFLFKPIFPYKLYLYYKFDLKSIILFFYLSLSIIATDDVLHKHESSRPMS